MSKQVSVNDLFELVSIAQPVVTQDSIFYLETRVRKQENDYATRVLGLNKADQHVAEWGTGNGQDKQLAVDPQRQHLYFTSTDDNGVRQVFQQSLQGGSPVQVSNEPFGVETFRLAKDYLYYQTSPKKDNQVPKKADPKFPKTVHYSKTIYKDNDLGYFAEDVLHVIKQQSLASIDAESKTVFISEERFSLGPISHSGFILTLSRDAHPDQDWDFATETILLDVEKDTQTSVLNPTATGTLSPVDFNESDTELLAWGSSNEIPNISAHHLYNIHLVDNKVRDLTPDRDVVVGDVIMAADFQQNLSGQPAAFTIGNQFVYQQLINGTVRLVTGVLEDSLEAHQTLVSGYRHVTDFCVADDGQNIYFTQSDAVTPSKLTAVSVSTKAETELINPNAEYEATHHIVAPQRLTFKNEQQEDVYGWYFAPESADSLTKYPAILYIHGGPGANYGETFFHELQVHAALGYGVIAVNPHGSTSYGEDYQHSEVGHYGEGDYDDLMASVDHVLELDQKVDEKRLYVTGGSYGGFMTNWIVGHTQRFKAAVTARSICNWISMFGTSDIGYYFLPWELTGNRTMKATDLEPMWNASPLKFVENVKTPTLILHSEKDFRCPIEQGEQWYTSLKLNGVETEMVRFPNENHDLSRIGLPSLRIERIQRINDWFEKH